MKKVLVTQEVLDLYDAYEEDFGLLHERGAKPQDRERFTPEQLRLLEEYVDKLHFLKLDEATYSPHLREAWQQRLGEIEQVMDPAVAATLRSRVLEGVPRAGKAGRRRHTLWRLLAVAGVAAGLAGFHPSALTPAAFGLCLGASAALAARPGGDPWLERACLSCRWTAILLGLWILFALVYPRGGVG